MSANKNDPAQPTEPLPATSSQISDGALEGMPRGPFADVRRRVALTIRYYGWRTLLFRIFTFPLRFTPLRDRMRLRSAAGRDGYREALTWYRSDGSPVDIVIPS